MRSPAPAPHAARVVYVTVLFLVLAAACTLALEPARVAASAAATGGKSTHTSDSSGRGAALLDGRPGSSPIWSMGLVGATRARSR